MAIIVTPSELHVDPVLGGHGAIVLVPLLVQEGRLADLPLVCGEEKNIGAR